jgi:hypothetical protein
MSWGVILWLVGLSAITFFAIAWLLDISNRQRDMSRRLSERLAQEDEAWTAEAPEGLLERLNAGEEHAQKLSDEIARLGEVLPKVVQAVGLVRFQAFSDYGGDQSFALAIANTTGDGVVMSGIFGREGTRVYAKPLSGWASDYSLSFEEQEAIKQARGQLGEGGTEEDG